MWTRGYGNLGGVLMFGWGCGGGRQSQVILSQSLCTKKWEGLGGKQNSFIICVYTRSNQPDFCAVIHPKITWNQIGTFHFFFMYSYVILLLGWHHRKYRFTTRFGLVSNNCSIQFYNVSVTHYSSSALLIWDFPCGWFPVPGPSLTTFNLFVVKQEMTVFWNHGNDSGFLYRSGLKASLWR